MWIASETVINIRIRRAVSSKICARQFAHRLGKFGRVAATHSGSPDCFILTQRLERKHVAAGLQAARSLKRRPILRDAS